MVASPALSGHAAADHRFLLSVTLDMLHVAGAGLWIGGLLLVLVAGIPAMRRLTEGNRDAAVSALVSSFHPLALLCGPLVVLSGIGASWLRLGSLASLWTTEYGFNLLWKTLFVALVATMGLYNWRRVRPRLVTAEGTPHIRRTASVELLFAAFVIAITTVLVSTPLPTEIAPR